MQVSDSFDKLNLKVGDITYTYMTLKLLNFDFSHYVFKIYLASWIQLNHSY